MNRLPHFQIPRQLINLLVLLPCLLTGCAVVPDNWPFEEEIIKTDALSQVKRIALLDIPPPDNIRLGPSSSEDATWWLGTIGMLTVEDAEGNAIISNTQLSESTRKELGNWLELAGMEVILIEAERKKQSKMLEDYSQFTQVKADAILEVAPITMGFADELGRAEFEFCAFPPCESKADLSPDVAYRYRLVSIDSGEILIESNVTYSSFYHYHSLDWPGIKLSGPREHIFDDEKSVKEQPEEAVRRLQYAIKETTKLISEIVTNKGRALTKDPYVGKWRSERGSSSGSLFPYTVTVINDKLAKYNSARANDRGRIVVTSKSNEGRWEGYWIGSRPAKTCIEEREGSRNWGIVIWQFYDTGSRFKGTWDFCGEGRKYQWTGRR